MVQKSNTALGVSFFKNQLYYAVNKINGENMFSRIGSVDFSYDLFRAVRLDQDEHLAGIRKSINSLKDEFDVNQIRMLSHPVMECWTTLPKIVYDEPDEREDHIRILMYGVERKHIEPTWYSLSNQDYKFLMLRDHSRFQNLRKLTEDVSSADLFSDFEIGERWGQFSGTSGSFMTICCFKNCISICSFIFGNLRGATYIKFDDPEDLPYLWLQHAQQLTWMQGLHEYIYLYGYAAYRIIEILDPFWDDAAEVVKMDTLEKMGVSADEKTYGFNLELAFPSIMLALPM